MRFFECLERASQKRHSVTAARVANIITDIFNRRKRGWKTSLVESFVVCGDAERGGRVRGKRGKVPPIGRPARGNAAILRELPARYLDQKYGCYAMLSIINIFMIYMVQYESLLCHNLKLLFQ